MGKKWLSLVATVFAASCLAGTECSRADCRESFEASFYLGMSIDGFAAGEVRRYLNPGAADVLQERGLAGINFAYRLLGAQNNTPASVDAGHPTPEEEKTMARTSKAGQLWVYGETTHGTRSMDLNCGAGWKPLRAHRNRRFRARRSRIRCSSCGTLPAWRL